MFNSDDKGRNKNVGEVLAGTTIIGGVEGVFCKTGC